jgi:hypothetical protein
MTVAKAPTPVGLGQIHALGFEADDPVGCIEFGATGSHQALNGRPGLVQAATSLAALVGLEVTKAPLGGGDSRLLSEEGRVDL